MRQREKDCPRDSCLEHRDRNRDPPCCVTVKRPGLRMRLRWLFSDTRPSPVQHREAPSGSMNPLVGKYSNGLAPPGAGKPSWMGSVGVSVGRSWLDQHRPSPWSGVFPDTEAPPPHGAPPVCLVPPLGQAAPHDLQTSSPGWCPHFRASSPYAATAVPRSVHVPRED